MECERAVRIVFQRLVLGAGRIAVEVVRDEEMMLVVERQSVNNQKPLTGGVWSFGNVKV
jgi:hypothetical protein